MGADLPPYSDEGANHLYRQRYHYDDTDDARRIAVFHPEKTAEVTYDREEMCIRDSFLGWKSGY